METSPRLERLTVSRTWLRVWPEVRMPLDRGIRDRGPDLIQLSRAAGTFVLVGLKVKLTATTVAVRYTDAARERCTGRYLWMNRGIYEQDVDLPGGRCQRGGSTAPVNGRKRLAGMTPVIAVVAGVSRKRHKAPRRAAACS